MLIRSCARPSYCSWLKDNHGTLVGLRRNRCFSDNKVPELERVRSPIELLNYRVRALLNEHLEYSSHDECFQDDDYKMNKINFRVKELFHARAGTVNNELMWTCDVVIDGIEGVNRGTQMRFLSKPYGLPDNYIIDHQTNFVWFKKKKMAEQAAASAALDGLNKLCATPSQKTMEASEIDIVHQQQVDKLFRRIIRERSLAVQSLRLCMQNDDSGHYFRTTMSTAMGESFNDAYSMEIYDDKNKLLIQRYKQLFKDTVPGFFESFESRQESSSFGSDFFQKFNFEECELSTSNFKDFHFERLDQLNIPNSTLEAILNQAVPSYNQFEYLLDWLVKTGFSDTKRAKVHRESRKYITLLEETETALAAKQDIVIERKQKLHQVKSNLVRKEREFASRYEELFAKNHKEKYIKSNIMSSFIRLADKIMSFLDIRQPIDDAETNNIREKSIIEMKEEKKRMKLELGKLRNLLQLSERALDTSTRSVNHLQEQKEKYERIISNEQFITMENGIQTAYTLFAPLHAKFIADRHKSSLQHYAMIQNHTDLTKPHEWYLYARLQQRKVIFHGGPTNSGKTFAALEALRRSQHGIYLGPLRLLAGEIYEKLTSMGNYTNLHTGQEKREVAFSTHTSATVEIAPTDTDFDVGVIDEIQMLGDESRGHAWTRALLGLRAKEIHVCGGLEALPLVKKLVHDCGDHFEVRRYERFSELNVLDYSLASSHSELGSFQNVQAGDCIVCFSRKDIFAVKREIERSTRLRCCVIYGALPPETRSSQARLFNDRNSGYDVLVASDAIGMGLNLNIKRIVFNSVFKSNGEKIVLLNRSEVKQIAGRAGRRNSPYPNGEITCRDPRDLEYIRHCLSNDVPPIAKAGLMPTSGHIQIYSETLSKFTESNDDSHHLHNILRQFNDMATVEGDYFLCRQNQMQIIAKMLKMIPLDLATKYSISTCPVNTTDMRSLEIIKRFALKKALGESPGLTTKMYAHKPISFEELSHMCDVHHELELFIWLSTRFPGNDVEQQRAFALKEHAIKLISDGLSKSQQLKLDHDYIKRDARLRRAWKLANENSSEAEDYFAYIIDDEFEDVA